MNEIIEVLKNIQKEDTKKEQKLDKGLMKFIFIIAVIAVLFIIAGNLVFSSVYLKRLYWNYVGELSNSTVYAYEHEGITISDYGNTFVISGNKVYVFYKKFSNADFREVNKEIDTEQGSLYLDFGNGCTLEIWEVEKGTSTKNLLYLNYKNAKGRIFKCNVEGVTLESIREYISLNHQ